MAGKPRLNISKKVLHLVDFLPWGEAPEGEKTLRICIGSHRNATIYCDYPSAPLTRGAFGPYHTFGQFDKRKFEDKITVYRSVTSLLKALGSPFGRAVALGRLRGQ